MTHNEYRSSVNAVGYIASGVSAWAIVGEINVRSILLGICLAWMWGWLWIVTFDIYTKQRSDRD